jgi:hypothetical protein
MHRVDDEAGTFAWRLSDEVHAMSEGPIGWAGAQAEVDSPFSGGTIQYRFSCVLHLEHGEWKIVHHHSAVPTPNEEHGVFLTKSLDEIVEAVNDARPDLSSTSAPDRTITIAFTDIQDSMKLNAFLGDQRWLDVLHVHQRRRDEGHGRPRRHDRQEAGGWLRAGLPFGPSRTDLRPSDRACDRRRVPRPRIDDPREDRHPRGRDLGRRTTSLVTP